MTLIEQISADFIKAFKESKGNEAKKAEKDFLGLLKSEVTKESKTPEDAYIVSKIKSMIKSAESSNSLNEAELNILNGYLPKQLSEQDLTIALSNEIDANGYDGMKDMGKLMGFLKSNYAGQYDGKMASTIVKSLLS